MAYDKLWITEHRVLAGAFKKWHVTEVNLNTPKNTYSLEIIKIFIIKENGT